MLVAADLLSAEHRSGAGPALTHDIIFVTLSGDSLDLIGSRAFLYDLENGFNSTAGIDVSKVDAVVEVGMTAAPSGNNATRLFVHSANATSRAQATLIRAGQAVDKLTVREWPHIGLAACMCERVTTNIVDCLSFCVPSEYTEQIASACR
jgi:hypothetical protein